MKLKALIFALLFAFAAGSAFADEYKGQFETTLVAQVEDLEWVSFKVDEGERLAKAGKFNVDTHFAAAKLQDPRTEQYSLNAFLVEQGEDDPVIYIDMNEDRSITPTEKFPFSRKGRRGWEAPVLLPVSEGSFKFCPIFLKYLEMTTTDKMGPEEIGIAHV